MILPVSCTLRAGVLSAESLNAEKLKAFSTQHSTLSHSSRFRSLRVVRAIYTKPRGAMSGKLQPMEMPKDLFLSLPGVS
jgi:hypothetical protein